MKTIMLITLLFFSGDALKDTVIGTQALNVAMAIQHRLLYDIIHGQQIYIPNLIESGVLQDKMNRQVIDESINSIKVAKLTKDIADARFQAADAAVSEKDKIVILQRALDDINKRRAIEIEDTKKALVLAGEQYKQQPDNIKAMNALIALQIKYNEVSGYNREARQIELQLTTAENKEKFKQGDYLSAVTKDMEVATKAAEKYARALAVACYAPTTPKIIYLQHNSAIAKETSIANVKAWLKEYKVAHADIVLAQIILETGRLTSKLCKSCHNLIGMKFPTSRRTTAVSISVKGYAVYTSAEDCIKDYAQWQSYKYTDKTEDYYQFLRRIGYASDSNYINKLKQLA